MASVKSKLLFYTGIVLCCLQLFSCNSADTKNAPGDYGQSAPKDFKVLTLYPRKANVNADFPATIQGQQIIEIRPKIDGYIDAIYVQEGAAVKKGQLLFRISNRRRYQARRRRTKETSGDQI